MNQRIGTDHHISSRLMKLAVCVVAVASVATSAGAVDAAHRRGHDRAPVTRIDTGDQTGTSRLVRSNRGVVAHVRTGGLQPRHAYTVWAIVFNYPGACAGGCDSSDLANPAVDGASVLGTGSVVRNTRASFRIRLRAGDVLTNPRRAEIHFVVRTHGPAITGVVREQISTLNGGCPPNTCVNLLVAKHD